MNEKKMIARKSTAQSRWHIKFSHLGTQIQRLFHSLETEMKSELYRTFWSTKYTKTVELPSSRGPDTTTTENFQFLSRIIEQTTPSLTFTLLEPSYTMDESQENTFLCCSSITVQGDERDQVLMYSQHYRDMLYLGKDLRGKVISREAKGVSVGKEQYPRGAIRVLDFVADHIMETKWYAAVGSSGPYGKASSYVQLDPNEVNKALVARELVESTTYMRYNICPNHPDRKFEACWYRFEEPKPIPSTDYSQYYDEVNSDGEVQTIKVTTPQKAVGGSKSSRKNGKK